MKVFFAGLLAAATARCGAGGSGAASGAAPDSGGTIDGGNNGGQSDAGSVSAPDAGGGGSQSDAGSRGGAPDAGSAGEFHLTVHLVGQGVGRVESAPAGISCPGLCSAYFPNSDIKLTAVANPGSGFAYWSGGCQNSDTNCTLHVYHDYEVWAAFEPPPPVFYSAQLMPKTNLASALNTSGKATGAGYGGQSLLADAFDFDPVMGRTTFIQFTNHETSFGTGITDRDVLLINVIENRDNSSRAVLWNNGIVTELGSLGGGRTWGEGVNRSNHVVGFSFTPDGARRAFLHDGHRMIDLGSLDGTCSEATAINATGLIVGISCVASTLHAVIFHGDGTIEDLTPTSFGGASGVSESGYIVGRSGSEGFIRPPGGALRLVGTLPSGSGSELLGINDNGIAVGISWVPAYEPKGHLVTTERAAVWIAGRLWDLSYLVGSPELTFDEVSAINPRGQIAAHGLGTRADAAAWLLTPR